VEPHGLRLGSTFVYACRSWEYALDYSGSWETVANHQANAFNGSVNTDTATRYYMHHGVPSHKLVIGSYSTFCLSLPLNVLKGLPLYGRSFMNTDGPGTPFSGVGPGSLEPGTYDYRALPLPNAQVHNDPRSLASWSYDSAKREMVSFDDAHVAKWKAEWIIKADFGGAMYWELSGDKTGQVENGREDREQNEGNKYVPGHSLVKLVKDTFGELDQSTNWLDYGSSRFDNMRKHME
jgi:chitinase